MRECARPRAADLRAPGSKPLKTVYFTMTAKPTRRFGPARVFRLGEEPLDDLSASTTPEERLQMVEVLSARMRELSGLPDEPLRRDCIATRSLTGE